MSYVREGNLNIPTTVNIPRTIISAVDYVMEVHTVWIANTSPIDIFLNLKQITVEGAGAPVEGWRISNQRLKTNEWRNFLISLVADKDLAYPVSYTLVPGQSLVMFSNSSQQAFQGSVMYREFLET